MPYIINLLKIRSIDCMKYIYHKFPLWIKYGIKFHLTYKKTYNLLNKSQFWSEDEIIQYQNSKLKELILYAYNNTSYYKELFDKNNINPNDINTKKDLEKLPILTKEIVVRENKRLISKKFNHKKLIKHQTGGSTGKPATFYFDKYEYAKEKAYVRFIYDRIGYNDKEKTIVFEDSNAVREEKLLNENIFYKKIPGLNKWSFMYSNINLNTYKEIVNKIENISPQWIITFPSSLYQLAKCLESKNIINPFPSLKGIIFKSETLYPYQISLLKEIFPVKMLHVYGHTEHACIAGTCEKSLNFHIQPEYGISEFIDSIDEKKELIATGFNNLAMPLIRYKTEDLFIINNKTKCKCNRNYTTISSIEGRSSDFLYLNDGQIVPDIFCDFTIGKTSKWLNQCLRFRIIQYKIGECILEYIPLKEIKNQKLFETEMKNSCEEYFFNKMTIIPKKVSIMPKTSRGKDKLIISHIKSK